MNNTIGRHRIYIYQRPIQGSAMLASFDISNYRHRIVARGGYDTASGTPAVNSQQAQQIFDKYIGCVVRIYVDDPYQPIWEGFISRITYRVGGVMMTKSLDNMANRVSVTFYNADSAAVNKTEKTINYNNTASQAIYGIKQMNIDAGVHHNNANKTHKEILAQTILAMRAYPQISTAYGGGDGPLIELELQGLRFMAWDWQNYQNTDATLDNAAFLFGNVTSNSGSPYRPSNGDYIYDVTSPFGTGYIAPNAFFNMSRKCESGQTYLQFIQSIAEAGDGSRQFVYGISLPDPNDKLRRVYYRGASSVVKYQISAMKDAGIIRDTRGSIIPGWRIVPDGAVRIMDILIGYVEAGDDPRVSYIEAVEYDGDTGIATLQSGDNITMEGALQRDRYFRAHSLRDRFGAQPRQTL